MIRTLLVLLICVEMTFAMPAFAQQSDGDSLLLRGARLFIGDGQVIEEGAVLIQSGVIVAAGNLDEVLAPPGVTTIDVTGKTLMPALIDAHAHLGYQGRTSWGGVNYTRENLVDNLQQYAWYGFAAVFSAGSDPAGLAGQVEAARRDGEFTGARLLFAAGMAPPGQGPNNQFLEQVLIVENAVDEKILYGLENPAQARQAVREVAATGLRFIKIWVDDRGGTQQKLGADLYRPVIDEANAAGLQVLVHQQSVADMPDLLQAGVHGFLHGRLGPELDRAMADQVKASGAFIVPNLGLAELRREAIGEDPFLRENFPPAAMADLSSSVAGRLLVPVRDETQEAALRDSMAALLQAGVDIVLGTDAGAVPGHPFGYTGHRELEIYVRLGMSPAQALLAATGVAARQLGLDDLGRLSPGMSADLLVLDGNPLEDIRNTRRISQVYLRGKAVDRAALQGQWQP